MKSRKLLPYMAFLLGFGACTQRSTAPSAARVEKQRFGAATEAGPVDLYTLTNGGVEVRAMTYGGIIVSLRVPGRDGNLGDVVLGYDTLDGYLKASPYFGAIIGRYGNRIARGQFTLDGQARERASLPNGLHVLCEKHPRSAETRSMTAALGQTRGRWFPGPCACSSFAKARRG